MDIQLRVIAKKVFPTVMSLIVIVSVGLAWADAEKPRQDSSAVAATNHTIRLKGKTIAYSATAGFISICNKTTGAPEGEIFFVYYKNNEGRDVKKRPVTFAFNGGPGAASMYLHLAALGPRTIPRSADGTTLLPPPYSLHDNENTLLDFTDLVFIDPIGTGFSRAVAGVDPRRFWGVKEDVNAITDFVFQFLTAYGRVLSPLFIAGESYGGVRGVGLAKALQDAGLYPMGIVLISPALDLQNIQWSSLGDRAMLLSLPSYCAAAWHHQKVAPRLRKDLGKTLEEVRKWTTTDLLPAFWKGDSLTDVEREGVAKRLSEYTGIDPRWIMEKNIRIREREFAGQLLKNENRSISVYDSRVTALGPYTGDDNDGGAFLLAGPLKTAMTDYISRELNFRTERRYLSGNSEVYLDWNWESGRVPPVNADSINTGYPDSSNDFAQALNRCHFLKVFIASGIFDLEVPYDSVRYTINHLDIPKERKNNISIKTYPGGHMHYANPEAHRKLREDIRTFYENTLKGL